MGWGCWAAACQAQATLNENSGLTVWVTSSCAACPPSGFKERKECFPDEKFQFQPLRVAILVHVSINYVQLPEG